MCTYVVLGMCVVCMYMYNSYAGVHLGRSPRGGKSNSEDSLGGGVHVESSI